jgi:hypothetical protein
MEEGYDRERTAALVDEARKLTAALKMEASDIKSILDRAFDDEDGEEKSDVNDVTQTPTPKFKWWFWR